MPVSAYLPSHPTHTPTHSNTSTPQSPTDCPAPFYVRSNSKYSRSSVPSCLSTSGQRPCNRWLNSREFVCVIVRWWCLSQCSRVLQTSRLRNITKCLIWCLIFTTLQHARCHRPFTDNTDTNRLGELKAHDLTLDFFELGEGEDITDVQVTVEDL